METNNTSKKNEYKKLIIICSTIALVAAMALVGVLVLKNNSSKSDYEMMGDLSDFEMTYEDFAYGLKEDMSADEQAQVEALYNEFLEASKNNDENAMMDIFARLDELDLYDESMMGQMVELTEEEWAELDPDGDGIIVFEDGEIPEGFEAGEGN